MNAKREIQRESLKDLQCTKLIGIFASAKDRLERLLSLSLRRWRMLKSQVGSKIAWDVLRVWSWFKGQNVWWKLREGEFPDGESEELVGMPGFLWRCVNRLGMEGRLEI